MNLFGAVQNLFLPQIKVRPGRSLYEGDAEQERRERPLQAHAQTRWMQSDIESAIILADSGDLTLAARLSRSMRRDGTFSGIMSTRAGGLTRLPKIFRGTPEVLCDLEAQSEVGLFDRVFPAKELELMDSDGINLGVGVGEMLPFPGRREPIFVRLDPEFLRYIWSEDQWYYLSVAGRIPVNPGDGRWILHCPGGYQAPWSNALWPSLGRAFVAKEHAYLYRENYSGKLANPARVAVSPQGATEEQTRGFFAKLMAWGLNTVFSLPPGWDVRLLESNGVGYDVFKDTIESADKEFMIGIAGQLVTVTGGAGFANANIHASIRSDLIQGDGDALAHTINTQGLRPLVNRLYGAAARGRVQWDTRPPADLKAEAEAMSSAGKAVEDVNRALAPYGLRMDAIEVAKRFKLPTIAMLSAGPSANDGGVAPAPAAGAPPAPAPAASGTAANPVEGELMDAAPSDESAAALAAKMTEHGVARCEHGYPNRCRLCGVERTRDFTPGVNGGEHEWTIAWRPIAAQRAA